MSKLPYNLTITPEIGSGDQPNKIRIEHTEPELVDGSNASGERARNLLTTLPYKFKSLRGTSIAIDSEDPVDLIELLGNILEIADYPTNMASFWFLDMLARQILNYYKDLNEHYLSVLISWLIGEMTLLRDREHSREEFFNEMKDIFLVAANEVSEQGKLLYWDQIVYEHDEEEEGIEEEEETQDFVIQNESPKSLQKEQLKEPRSNMDKSEQSVVSSLLQETIAVDPFFALDKVIESTYDMYANELRYALIYAVFVESVEVQIYNLPFVLRTPRLVKFVDKTCFNKQLRDSFKKAKSFEKTKKSKGKKKGKAGMMIPPTPAPSLLDDNIFVAKRLFILPLIEANEALQVFDM